MAPYTPGDNGGHVDMKVGYSVDDGRDATELDERLPLLQYADLQDKVVLLRVDHNVVKKGKILDQYRVDVTLATMYNIVERGGRPIIMTHIGRPFDKKTKTISMKNDESVDSVVAYLQRKLRIKFAVPQFHAHGSEGIDDIDTSINWLIHDLRSRKIGGIYLPNTRWFAGEEDKGEKMERFVVQLAGLADVYVNDAFGSWQSHASTYHITKYLPSYLGLCMQDELMHVKEVLNPKKPFVAIVAGSKYDTKIGPLTAMYERVDKIILGGVMYNTYLCAKYGVKIAGVEDSDIELAKELVEKDKNDKKVLELPHIVETDTLEGRIEGKYRTIYTKDFKAGDSYKYVVDVDPSSFEVPEVLESLQGAKTIFVNAVMGLMPHFKHGTSKMDEVIDSNKTAQKFFGGGDTLQEFKSLHPGLYHAALDSAKYYLFTGGGTVLKVLEEGDPFKLENVKALMQNAETFGYKPTNEKW
ncbi:phosphoglycerate kinase [Marchantia polymorpha subsp. ruderalis]|uniref:Phosphoglycerate kinase n=2 Tax=Marchantia polymorpha TaxID=3197 RepID=A0AAF6BYG4_MARPO|nr:hypothetical protein MARPO_0003s0167 [Marchantia polymorpha]BBN17048.1 hypothetical protein Mp_7g11540 [Marchantia polymorpha subsp. ruderalis]|eukprot:PTQ49284.1 hypothetical protein MARPO_0003s0167 [Marchantia polymorpha]